MTPLARFQPSRRRAFDSAAARPAQVPSADALAGQQFGRLQRIWADAAANVPYYAGLVRAGAAPASLECWGDFHALPVLTKQLIQDDPAAFRRPEPPDAVARTGGSTGTPLSIGLRRSEQELMRVVKMAAWRQLGYTLSSRLFLIWGHSHLLGTGWRGRVNHLRRKAADWALGYQRVDAYRLNHESCLSHARRLIAFRPAGLIGYASALDLFARHTIPMRAAFHGLGLKFVLITSEPPPRPDTLGLLQDLFGCPVVQEYGGAEFGQIAFKVGDDPFSVYGDLNYVECEPPAAEDPTESPLLITPLYDRHTPLVRYRVGDAVTEPVYSAHGHVSAFRSLAGRVNDVVELAPGDFVHSVAVFHCVHQEPAVHNIQMILRDREIEVRLIGAAPDPGAAARIRNRLGEVHSLLGRATIAWSEDMLATRAGKRRWFVDERVVRPAAPEGPPTSF